MYFNEVLTRSPLGRFSHPFLHMPLSFQSSSKFLSCKSVSIIILYFVLGLSFSFLPWSSRFHTFFVILSFHIRLNCPYQSSSFFIILQFIFILYNVFTFVILSNLFKLELFLQHSIFAPSSFRWDSCQSICYTVSKDCLMYVQFLRVWR